jgi:hypothetical protein
MRGEEGPMPRRQTTPSEEFNIGYETGWAHRGREEAVRRDNMHERLKASLAITEAEMKKLKERVEAAERAQAKAERASNARPSARPRAAFENLG